MEVIAQLLAQPRDRPSSAARSAGRSDVEANSSLAEGTRASSRLP